MNILSSLKSLLEKAKKPKKYHQDFVDLETWKKIITYVFETLNIEDEVIDNAFSDSFSEKLFNYLDLLPTLEGISQEQVLELSNYLAEVFDLLLTNQNADQIISDLKAILELISKFEKEIPPVEDQVTQEDPEIAKEPTPDTPIEDGTETQPIDGE